MDAEHDIGRDAGFTLTEMLIVTVIIGIVTATLAAVFSVVVRTTPSAQSRTDDARSLQGLVTWLPQDVDATPPTGFNDDSAAWPCAAPSPPVSTSVNLLTMSWTERKSSTAKFAASYRYERKGELWSIVRYSCTDNETGVMGAATRNNLTAQLPAWGAPAPARVILCEELVLTGGTCDPDDVIAPSDDSTLLEVKSLRMTVTLLNGISSEIDAAPKNPDEDLSGDSYAGANIWPEVSADAETITMAPNDTTVNDLQAMFGVIDPDGADPSNPDLLSVAVDTGVALPPWLTVSVSDPLTATITTSPAAPHGVTGSVVLIIADDRGGWLDVTIHVKIIDPPNTAPYWSTVDTATITFSEMDSDDPPVIATIDLTSPLWFGITDDDGDTLTADVDEGASTVNASHVQTPGGIFGTTLTITADNAGPSHGGWVVVHVSDGQYTTTVYLDVVINPIVIVNTPPTVTPETQAISMYAGDTYVASLAGVDLEGQPLTATVTSAPAGYTTAVVGLNIEITAGLGVSPGPAATPVTVTVADTFGLTDTATITITIIPTPPPPSNCVLQSLTATPNPVKRQGSGSGPRHLKDNVTVTLTYSGSCDGLTLTYDTGDPSGLGLTGRVFPTGSPTSIVLFGNGSGGTEKWTLGVHALTASTTSSVTPNSLTVNLSVINP